MSTSDVNQRGHGAWHSKKWAGVSAAVSAGVPTVVAAVVSAGTPVITSPMATATTATPWVPRSIFGPHPAPQPRSAVGAQRTQQQANANGPDWAPTATPSFQAMQQALTGLGYAINGSDPSGLQAACQQLSSAGARFDATLPAPSQEMTNEARAAVGEINAMSTACLADSPDIDAVVAHANEASSHMRAVADLSSAD